ncbi:MAG: hypothetical protein SGILL_005474 [Bacillariaceae sp.]
MVRSEKEEDEEDMHSPLTFFAQFWNFFSPSERIEDRSAKRVINELDPNRTICFVSVDIGMGSDILTMYVVKRLEELLPAQQNIGDNAKNSRRLCHIDNLSISGTHTHSAPAGFLQYALYQVTSKGFSRKEVFDTYVESIAQSILQAYRNLSPTDVIMSTSQPLEEANINRSPTSYLLNPEWERKLYEEEGDTDKTMTQLTFVRHAKGEEQHAAPASPIAILNWFAVHGTSMNGTNTLISGDNKGYASYTMEQSFNGAGISRPTAALKQPDFVAAFAATNLGDVSPNTAGPRCIDTGKPCDADSTCNGKNTLCIAFGPGSDQQESTELIGQKQYDASMNLLMHAMSMSTNAHDQQHDPHPPQQQFVLNGPIAFRHAFINMANVTVTLKNGTTAKTCPAALGYAMAAGTTDGPGMFDFSQGQNTSNPFWNLIRNFLSAPSQAQKDCHYPKPILLNTGQATLPYAWDPKSVPISVFQIGDFYLLNVPAELTTMAGRRLRRAVEAVIEEHGKQRGVSTASNNQQKPQVTIAGLANSYTHYVTTFEEYAGQRYEAASTLYGPHTLGAYIQEFERLTRDLLNDRPTSSDDPPDDLLKRQISLITPAMADTVAIGKNFGSVARDANEKYAAGDTVSVSFRSANPRHNQRIGGSFLTVDRKVVGRDDNDSWETVYEDGDWCTKYEWVSHNLEVGFSFAEISWEVPESTLPGAYRICHYGTRKTWIGAYLEGFSLKYMPDWSFDTIFGSMALGWLWQLLLWSGSIFEPRPSCTCPDHAKGNLCKHVLFVLLKVMQIDPFSHMVFQSAWLSMELEDMFDTMKHRFNRVCGNSNVMANEKVQEAFFKIQDGGDAGEAAHEA